MDRGIPTEALLREMRTSRQETFYLVGTSRAKIREYEKQWLELPARRRVFNLPLVIWLMIAQRLDAKATMSTVVQQVAQRPQVLLTDHKRNREGTVSCHTGAYSDARQAMPLQVAERVADRVLDHLPLSRREALPGFSRRVFVLDGSSVEAPHTPELVKAYPPARNQHGASHWPVLRLLVADELTTGLAERPCWGPDHWRSGMQTLSGDKQTFAAAPVVNGPDAVSEQELTEPILDRLPDAAVVMGDINFSVFTVALAAVQRGHDQLFRLMPKRAKVVGHGLPLRPGTDAPVCWRPSAYERRQHPDLPADACVRGRLIVQQVVASNGTNMILYFFTTLEPSVEQILQLYGQRWDIETDLRSLKQTLKLQMLRCQSVDMVAKELVLAVVGYNLVRAVMNVAAAQNDLDPRRLSFSRSQDVVNAALPGLDAARTQKEYEAGILKMLRLVASCKLPDRSRRSATPRHVWSLL